MPRGPQRRKPAERTSPVDGVNELEILRGAQIPGYEPMLVDAENVVPWCDGPPTEPGFYWSAWKISPGSFQLERVLPVNGVLMCRRADGLVPAEQMERRWCGPLPLPDDAW